MPPNAASSVNQRVRNPEEMFAQPLTFHPQIHAVQSCITLTRITCLSGCRKKVFGRFGGFEVYRYMGDTASTVSPSA